MCKLIDGAAKEPAVQAAALDAVRRFGREPGSVPGVASLGRAAWWFAKHAVRVLPHEQFKALVAAFPEKQQLLLASEYLLSMPRPEGDCSAFSMLVCALLKCLGVRCELVTVAVDPREPEVFTHVYPRAVLEDGQRLPLDASHGADPGWEVPAYDVFRKQIWDTNGTPIPDSAAVPSRLHAYIRRGMGDAASDLTDPTFIQATNPIDWSTFGVQPGALPTTPAASTQPTWLESLIGGVVQGGTKIAGQVLAPTTYIKGPGGQMIETPASASGAVSTSIFGSGSIGSSSMIWLLLLGAGAFLLFTRRSQG
jgi:hypothetical protein